MYPYILYDFLCLYDNAYVLDGGSRDDLRCEKPHKHTSLWSKNRNKPVSKSTNKNFFPFWCGGLFNFYQPELKNYTKLGRTKNRYFKN